MKSTTRKRVLATFGGLALLGILGGVLVPLALAHFSGQEVTQRELEVGSPIELELDPGMNPVQLLLKFEYSGRSTGRRSRPVLALELAADGEVSWSSTTSLRFGDEEESGSTLHGSKSHVLSPLDIPHAASWVLRSRWEEEPRSSTRIRTMGLVVRRNVLSIPGPVTTVIIIGAFVSAVVFFLVLFFTRPPGPPTRQRVGTGPRTSGDITLTLALLVLFAGCAATAPRASSTAAGARASDRSTRALRPMAASPSRAAQEAPAPAFALGAELRVYPAGLIPGLYGEHALGEHGVLTFDLAANLTDRDDFGEHDDEEGEGFGGGLGYRYYFGERFDRWFVGGRVDLFSLSIDWKDLPGTPMETRGTSDVLVMMPTAELGYAIGLGARWRLIAFLAGGAEINLSTDGEDVGEGAIGLLGLSLVYGW